MRECRRDYAHGPMKLTSQEVQVEYRGESFTVEKPVLRCNVCNYELHLDWMEDKMRQDLEEAYRKLHSPA